MVLYLVVVILLLCNLIFLLLEKFHLLLRGPGRGIEAFLLLRRFLVLLASWHFEGLGEVDFLGRLHHGILDSLL